MIEKDRIKVLKQGIEEGFYPRYLYKYWSYESAIRYLDTGKIRYAPYNDFNDSFEGGFSLIGKSTKEEIISYHRQFSNIPQESAIAISDLITPDEHKALMNDCIRETLEQIGIFCMTNKNDSLLMWAHYANQHEGVCLKFDLQKDTSAFSSLHKVVYTTEFLNFNYITDSSRMNDILVHKSVDWLYEDEYRVLKPNCAGHLLPINPEALSEITFGCRMSPENRQHIKDILSNKTEYQVKFKQAGLHPQDFRLIIIDEGDSRIRFQ